VILMVVPPCWGRWPRRVPAAGKGWAS